MSYYFKLLSNIPGYETSLSYSVWFKSVIQNEAKDAEIGRNEKLEFNLHYLCDQQFLQYLSTNDLGLKGVCSGL